MALVLIKHRASFCIALALVVTPLQVFQSKALLESLLLSSSNTDTDGIVWLPTNNNNNNNNKTTTRRSVVVVETARNDPAPEEEEEASKRDLIPPVAAAGPSSDGDGEDASSSHHNPQTFSNPANVTAVVRRGMNVINAFSGCQVAKWVVRWQRNATDGSRYVYRNVFDDCYKAPATKQLQTPADLAQLQPNDTIYVTLVQMDAFVHDVLPLLTQDFVLMTGIFQAYSEKAPLDPHRIVQPILNHAHLLHWFCLEVEKYIGPEWAHHPKVGSFPLGLRPSHFKPDGHRQAYRFKSQHYFRQAFVDSMIKPSPQSAIAANNTTTMDVRFPQNKPRLIYASPMNVDTHASRQEIAQASTSTKKKLPLILFYKQLAYSQYVLSPRGIRTECHRHYEIIGMGGIPITGNDAFYFRHLQGTPVVYNTSTWNVTILEQSLNLHQHAIVNRNAAFEEFYLEYVERTVGRPLHWWDVRQHKPALLRDFDLSAPLPYKETPTPAQQSSSSSNSRIQQQQLPERRQRRRRARHRQGPPPPPRMVEHK